MTERPFDAAGSEAPAEYGALCDELRCHTTESVAAIRDEAVREQRRWRLRELAATRVLDERGQVDDRLAGLDGVSIRDVKATVATARALEDLPAIALVAAEGRLSDAQLAQVVKVADASDDREWAARAPRWSPADLAQKARELRKPTIEDAQARRAARELRWWWNRDRGMLDGRFSLPDVDGATFELVLGQMIEKMKPAPGHTWETFERRGADALMQLVQAYRERPVDETTTVPGAHLMVQVPLTGPATVAGIPLPDAMVEKLRTSGRIEPVLVDDDGAMVHIGRTQAAISPKLVRAVLKRDAQCRIGDCDVRGPLHVEHIIPRTMGGTDDISNLVAACDGTRGRHPLPLPHGPYLLVGNPNQPDGLTLVSIHDLPALAQLAARQAREDTPAA